jgi:transposase
MTSLPPSRIFSYDFSESDRDVMRTPVPLVIMANYLNRLGFIDYINRRLIWDPSQCKFSPGVLAQLLVLIPFIPSQRRISLFAIPHIYAKMDLELVTGYKIDPITEQEIRADELNDDLFARLLDRIFAYGCSKLFQDLAITVRTTFTLQENFILHSDTTSHVLFGNHSPDDESEDEISPIHITYGYSKDKQPNLKQIITGMITDGDGLALFTYPLDGNYSDTTWNAMIIALLHEIFGSEFHKYTYVADSKFMTKENYLALMSVKPSIPFISRVPQSFCGKLSERMKKLADKQNKWKFLGTCCNYPSKNAAEYYASTIQTNVYTFGVYVHVYKTTEKRGKIEREVEKEITKLEKEITLISKREFFCEEDAVVEMETFRTSHSKMMIEAELEVVREVTYKRPRGKSPKIPKPPKEEIKWKIAKLGIKRKEEGIEEKIKNASTFCLLTNISPDEKSSQEILLTYKAQSNVEGQFSILKQPLMAATIFLEKPKRIEALMILIYFAALLHGILRVLSRIELQKEENPPKWGNGRRAVTRPTSRTMLEILGKFTVVLKEGVTTIDVTEQEMEKEFERVLRVVRFDPGFV